MTIIALLAMLSLLIFYLVALANIPSVSDVERANFTYCDRSPRINCIVDGDTFWYEGRKIRISDINTPEISRPKCTAELSLARKAKTRLYQLMNDGSFALVKSGKDKDYFGRDLRIIQRNGRSIGDILIAEGLAHKWQGRKESWCLVGSL